jgi:hypothetical protein
MWTRFMDRHSGGGLKEKWKYIYIEAPKDEARVIFYNRFRHSPDRITCTCCGNDYWYDEYKTLKEASAYDRNCRWKRGRYVEEQNPSNMSIRKKCFTKSTDSWGLYMTLAQYLKRSDVHIIRKKNIKKSERVGEVPVQGYVWRD